MTNSEELRSIIERKGLKMKFVANYLGLSPYGFQLKVDNRQEFKTSEVSSLCKLLCIESLEDKERIFCQIVDLKSTLLSQDDTKGA